MKKHVLIICWVIGILHVHAAETDSKLTKSQAEPTADATSTQAVAATLQATDAATKDKRQIGPKETEVYPNHRSDTEVDDPETPQETIYGPKPNQFIIRPIAPHQHQQHEDQQQPQLRNYPATIRPHSSQLLEQSQEIQHFAYLQDISRNHAKTAVETTQPGKSHSLQPKKSSKAPRSQSSAAQYRNAEEAEQRYAVAIQPPQHQQYQPGPPYHLGGAPPPSQQPHGQPQQPYQVIPEEQFLKLLEEELQARAYHDEQIRQQQAAQAPNKPAPHLLERAGGQGLGNYRQHVPQEETNPEYVQYVPRHRGGPKYLPLSQAQQQQIAEAQIAEQPEQHRQQHQHQHHQQPQPSDIPPQLAYYQPQISYKTLPNHPLAKSSLENEIEKLLAANKPSAAALQIVDNSNEPSAVVHQHQHHQLPQPQPRPARPHIQSKAYAGSSPPSPTSTPQLDANNQPFIPSLFKFSNFQPPTPIYPTQVPPQVVEAKKLGPVVYPTQQPTAQPQPTQYYYQEIAPTPKTKSYRSKQYGSKVSPTPAKQRERDYNYPPVPAPNKYAAPLYFDYDRQQDAQQTGAAQFHPSPPDPNNPQQQQAQSTQAHPLPPPQHNLRQYVLPAPAPSQSSIFVSQGTGITTPSYPTTIKPKTAEDVRQLRLPQPGGKPLTQSEFQALVDAGYPVTAVPVPVPVPYEQYIKAHPEYRNQPPVDYAQLMHRLSHQYAARRNPHALGSEPSVKIVSSPSEPQTVTATGGGSITYLRPIPGSEQKRHPREDQDTAVAGKVESAKQ